MHTWIGIGRVLGECIVQSLEQRRRGGMITIAPSRETISKKKPFSQLFWTVFKWTCVVLLCVLAFGTFWEYFGNAIAATVIGVLLGITAFSGFIAFIIYDFENGGEY
jgi:hypothetical protein